MAKVPWHDLSLENCNSTECFAPYEDIIKLPHHVSPSADAALTDYEAAIGETARLTSEWRELDVQEAEEKDDIFSDLN